MHRYTILCQLGDGSFGVVSKACHTTTGEIVAVKKMKQRFASWEECLQLREIQSLRRLQHPNIIKLKEVVRENTELFMIFEFMEMNVYQITRLRSEQLGNVNQNIFTDKEVRSIMCQTLLGLSAIHKGGFMHRDLKPENLLTKGDTVKIADFGLAKEIRSRPPFTEYVSTRWYRAPEIILRSTHYNSPIDIWACGVIFAELYLNRPLFPGGSDTDQLFKICSVLGPPNPAEWDEGYQLARRLNIRFPPMAPTPLRQIIPNAPAVAIDIIEQMLRYNPSERPTATMCLQHPFFTGSTADSMAGSNYSASQPQSVSSLYSGISTGQAHNPFHIAAGVPTVAGGSGVGQFTGARPAFPVASHAFATSPTPQGNFGLPVSAGTGTAGAPQGGQQRMAQFGAPTGSSNVAAAYGGFHGSPPSPNQQPMTYHPLYTGSGGAASGAGSTGGTYSSGQARTTANTSTTQNRGTSSSFDEFQY
jgi:protein kinase